MLCILLEERTLSDEGDGGGDSEDGRGGKRADRVDDDEDEEEEGEDAEEDLKEWVGVVPANGEMSAEPEEVGAIEDDDECDGNNVADDDPLSPRIKSRKFIFL